MKITRIGIVGGKTLGLGAAVAAGLSQKLSPELAAKVKSPEEISENLQAAATKETLAYKPAPYSERPKPFYKGLPENRRRKHRKK